MSLGTSGTHIMPNECKGWRQLNTTSSLHLPVQFTFNVGVGKRGGNMLQCLPLLNCIEVTPVISHVYSLTEKVRK